MSQKIAKRHPANFVFERYEPFRRLILMGQEFSVKHLQKDNPKSPEIVYWRIANGMRIGLLARLVDVISAYEEPSQDFYNDMMKVLHEWIKDFPNWSGCNIDGSGVWGGEMQAIAEMRIKGMWHRFLAKQRYKMQLLQYSQAYMLFLLQAANQPSSKEYEIHSADASHLRNRVAKGLEYFGSDFNLNKMFLDDLL